MKYSLLAVILLTGCTGFTGVGVAEKLSKERTERYQMSIQAHDIAVKNVMETLSKVDRGGMKIETTSDGKIKGITYTEKLDMNIIAKALETPHYQEEKVQSILSEVGDFMLKATNMIVPVASIYYGSKNQIANTEAQVLMNQSNNQAQTSMVGSYTGNFQNTTNVDTSTTVDSKSTSVDKSVSTSNVESYPNVTTNTTGVVIN